MRIDIRTKPQDCRALTDLTIGPSGETATSIGNSDVVSPAASLSSLRPNSGGGGGLAGVERLPFISRLVGNLTAASSSADTDGVLLVGELMVVVIIQAEVEGFEVV